MCLRRLRHSPSNAEFSPLGVQASGDIEHEDLDKEQRASAHTPPPSEGSGWHAGAPGWHRPHHFSGAGELGPHPTGSPLGEYGPPQGTGENPVSSEM